MKTLVSVFQSITICIFALCLLLTTLHYETTASDHFSLCSSVKSGNNTPPDSLPVPLSSDHGRIPSRRVDACSEPLLSVRPWALRSKRVTRPGAHRDKYVGDWPNVAMPQKDSEVEFTVHLLSILMNVGGLTQPCSTLSGRRGLIHHYDTLSMLLLLLNAAFLRYFICITDVLDSLPSW